MWGQSSDTLKWLDTLVFEGEIQGTAISGEWTSEVTAFASAPLEPGEFIFDAGAAAGAGSGKVDSTRNWSGLGGGVGKSSISHEATSWMMYRAKMGPLIHGGGDHGDTGTTASIAPTASTGTTASTASTASAASAASAAPTVQAPPRPYWQSPAKIGKALPSDLDGRLWEVMVDDIRCMICIGLLQKPKEGEPVSSAPYPGGDGQSWGLMSDGNTYHNGSSGQYLEGFGSGDVISVVWRRCRSAGREGVLSPGAWGGNSKGRVGGKGEITFFKNKKMLGNGPVYMDLDPSLDLHPAVGLCSTGDAVTLLGLANTKPGQTMALAYHAEDLLGRQSFECGWKGGLPEGKGVTSFCDGTSRRPLSQTPHPTAVAPKVLVGGDSVPGQGLLETIKGGAGKGDPNPGEGDTLTPLEKTKLRWPITEATNTWVNGASVGSFDVKAPADGCGCLTSNIYPSLVVDVLGLKILDTVTIEVPDVTSPVSPLETNLYGGVRDALGFILVVAKEKGEDKEEGAGKGESKDASKDASKDESKDESKGESKVGEGEVVATSKVVSVTSTVTGKMSAAVEQLFVLDGVTAPSAISLSDDRLTAEHVGTEGTKCMVLGTQGFTRGVHYWEVKIETCGWGTMNIGVTERGKQGSNPWGDYGFVSYRCKMSPGGGQEMYGKFFNTGDVIGVLLDMDRGLIAYIRDGDDFLSGRRLAINQGTATHFVRSGGIGGGRSGPGQPGSKSVTLYPSFGFSKPTDKITLKDAKWHSLKNSATPRQMLDDAISATLLLSHWDVSKKLSSRLPGWFVREAHALMGGWRHGLLQYAARAGVGIAFDPSESACRRAVGRPSGEVVKGGTRFGTPSGEAKILGAYQGNLWFQREGEDSGAW